MTSHEQNLKHLFQPKPTDSNPKKLLKSTSNIKQLNTNQQNERKEEEKGRILNDCRDKNASLNTDEHSPHSDSVTGLFSLNTNRFSSVKSDGIKDRNITTALPVCFHRLKNHDHQKVLCTTQNQNQTNRQAHQSGDSLTQ